MKKGIALGVSGGVLAVLSVIAVNAFRAADTGLPSLTVMGRASVKIVTQSGFVVYVDPFVGEYSQKADMVLVTHGHSDHNTVSLVNRNPDCVVAAPKYAVGIPHRTVKEGDTFESGPVRVECVAAYNGNHPRDSQVGYLIAFDGITVYHAGDTSKIPEMGGLHEKNITYALLPVDGYYNMGPSEAAECAALIGAKHVVPIHSDPKGPYNKENSEAFKPAGRILVEPGKSIALKP